MTYKFKHIRHATSIIEVDGKRFLIDPLLAAAKSYPPIVMTKNPLRNPLVDLKMDYKDLFKVQGVIVTHDHIDHFDKLAKKELPRDLPTLCQPTDFQNFTRLGFTNLTVANCGSEWMGFNCNSYLGSHGGGILKSLLGKSSSFLLKHSSGKSIYLSGDTLLTTKVQKKLKELKPGIIVANGGGARLKLVGQITMNNKDIISMSDLLPNSKIVAVHMDSINHCFDKKESLKGLINDRKIYVPEDGEELEL